MIASTLGARERTRELGMCGDGVANECRAPVSGGRAGANE